MASPAEDFVRAGDPAGALRALTEAVRARPSDARLRIFLAQLLCVLGQWERALQQFALAAELDPLAVPMQRMCSDAIRCEQLRTAVFAGTRTPLVFGEPNPWVALLVESLLRQGRGEADLAEDLRQRAFDAAPATPGTLDGVPFAWLADADMRLGPVLEACVEGRYYWIPFDRLARVQVEPPADLRDVVWQPARLEFANGGEALALLPTRYEGTAASGDGLLQLARRTDWRELRPGVWAGTGQRVLGSDAGDHALLDLREIVFAPASDAASDAASATPADDGAPRHG